MAKTEGTLAIGTLILAAGRSSRMGQPKLLLPWRGTTILGHLLAQWKTAGARQVTVVCAKADHALEMELDRLGFAPDERIYNPRPEQGMFSSIQCAAKWSGWRSDLTHFAVALGDQPHLRDKTLARLLEFSTEYPDRICQPSAEGRGRHPVLLPGREFLELALWQGATLKQFLGERGTALCEIKDEGLALDIDTPEDYQRVFRYRG